jgi:hypothetical protein
MERDYRSFIYFIVDFYSNASVFYFRQNNMAGAFEMVNKHSAFEVDLE